MKILLISTRYFLPILMFLIGTISIRGESASDSGQTFQTSQKKKNWIEERRVAEMWKQHNPYYGQQFIYIPSNDIRLLVHLLSLPVVLISVMMHKKYISSRLATVSFVSLGSIFIALCAAEYKKKIHEKKTLEEEAHKRKLEKEKEYQKIQASIRQNY